MAARRRAPDFSLEEVTVLVEEFVRYNTVLSAKFSSTTTAVEKKDTMTAIVSAVNAVGVHMRNVESIKEKWQSLKKQTKAKWAKYTAAKKRAGTRTGGGPVEAIQEPELQDWEKKILSIIPTEAIEGQ